MPRIETLLVANRGEIARRVIRSARSLGIRTVAVYSEPDCNSPHVRDAHVAVALGGATSVESYLDGGKIIAAARASGADALHPGYGFLSENADFAEACADAGLLFVGPSPDSMRQMGLKDRAKEIARRAGVPVLPDAEISGDNPEEWHAAARDVGFPLLVKAVAGGGGKGMRLVHDSDELEDAIAAARREAASAFGDPTVFLERYLQSARHVEIQVFADQHGAAVHLGERECSVQRRHQKVLEEAPSPAVGSGLRDRMGTTAVSLARALGYVGAGTVEYLLDDRTDEFFFLEMNTRLQVEHPVTEEVTGLDLVAMQLRVAQGEPLGLQQADVVTRGWAIEVRLYAEDPGRGFLPTPGRLHHYAHPSGPGLRFEDGVAAPGDISAFYDPMLAKIIAHGGSRAEAAASLAAALDATEIHGVVTNRAFLSALLRDPDFLAGATRTDFLDRHPHLVERPPRTPPTVHLAAAVAASAARRRAGDPLAGSAPPGFRPLAAQMLTTARWRRDGEEASTPVEYRLGAALGDTELLLRVASDPVRQFRLLDLRHDGVRVSHDGVDYPCTVAMHADDSVWVNDGREQSGWHPSPRLPISDIPLGATSGGPIADLPGTVVAISVEVGQRVTAGQKLVVLEAMKMEHPVTAAFDGVVGEIFVAVGQYVPGSTTLLTVVQAEA